MGMLHQHAAANHGASLHLATRSGVGAQLDEVDSAGERIVHRQLHQLVRFSPPSHQ